MFLRVCLSELLFFNLSGFKDSSTVKQFFVKIESCYLFVDPSAAATLTKPFSISQKLNRGPKGEQQRETERERRNIKKKHVTLSAVLKTYLFSAAYPIQLGGS